jgi:hypothetical protein
MGSVALCPGAGALCAVSAALVPTSPAIWGLAATALLGPNQRPLRAFELHCWFPGATCFLFLKKRRRNFAVSDGAGRRQLADDRQCTAPRGSTCVGRVALCHRGVVHLTGSLSKRSSKWNQREMILCASNHVHAVIHQASSRNTWVCQYASQILN